MYRLLSWPIILRLLAASFVGLALCRLIDYASFGGVEDFDRTPVGRVLTIFFGVVWGATLLFLVPLRLLGDRPKIHEMKRRVDQGEVDPRSMGPLRHHLFYANYGSLPKWLYRPFVVIALILGSIIALALIAFVVLYVLTHVFGT